MVIEQQPTAADNFYFLSIDGDFYFSRLFSCSYSQNSQWQIAILAFWGYFQLLPDYFSPFQVISYHYTSMLSHLLILPQDASSFQVPSCASNTVAVLCNSLVRYLHISHFISFPKNPFPAPDSITQLGYFSSLCNVQETTLILLFPVFSEKENLVFFQKTLTQIKFLFSIDTLENTKEE